MQLHKKDFIAKTKMVNSNHRNSSEVNHENYQNSVKTLERNPLEPAIQWKIIGWWAVILKITWPRWVLAWSQGYGYCDTGQLIYLFDSCRLTMTWMSMTWVEAYVNLKGWPISGGWLPCCATSGIFRPLTMPLAIFTMEIELYGSPILCIRRFSISRVMALRSASH